MTDEELLGWCREQSEGQAAATEALRRYVRSNGLLNIEVLSDLQIARRLGILMTRVTIGLEELRREGVIAFEPVEPDARLRRTRRRLVPGPSWKEMVK